MQCNCGFCFSPESLAGAKRGFDSYAVINDRAYRRFIKLELAAMASSEVGDMVTYLSLLARASKYVGSIRVCPKCYRLLFVRPGTRQNECVFEIYRRENVKETGKETGETGDASPISRNDRRTHPYE